MTEKEVPKEISMEVSMEVTGESRVEETNNSNDNKNNNNNNDMNNNNNKKRKRGKGECFDYVKNGFCKFGESCRFSHGIDTSELNEEEKIEHEAKRIARQVEYAEKLAQSTKISLKGLSKFWKKKDLIKVLEQKWAVVKYTKVMKSPTSQIGYVEFENVEDRDVAMAAIDNAGSMCGTKLIVVKIAEPYQEDKRKEFVSDLKKGENFTPPESVKEVVTPWWNIPYDEQLNKKKEKMEIECITKMYRSIDRHYDDNVKNFKKHARREPEIYAKKTIQTKPQWLVDGLKKNMKIACHDVKPSPIQEGYRNKCEFTFGQCALSKDVPKPELGFRVSKFTGGSVDIMSPMEAPNVMPYQKKFIGFLSSFLNHNNICDQFPIFDPLNNTGFWRFVKLRSSEITGDTMMMLCYNGDHINDKEKLKSFLMTDFLNLLSSIEIPDMVEKEMGFSTEKFSSLKDGNMKLEEDKNTMMSWCGLTSICFQEYNGMSCPAQDHPYELVWGKPYSEEILLGNRFKISPGSFFQVNTPAAELLYSTVIEHCSSEKDKIPDVIYDVCCGTGTIGICAANITKAKKVVGIELCQAAVEDAKLNAELNKTENTEFICDKAEAVLKDMLKKMNDKFDQNIVAIVDPPRQGLNGKCIEAIRNCEPIKRLVYVACHPTGAIPNDAKSLCGPVSKKYTGTPFKPVAAYPIDLFPQTDNTEMIMIFDRLSEEEYPREKIEEKPKEEVVVKEEENKAEVVKEEENKAEVVKEEENKEEVIVEEEEPKEEVVVKEEENKEEVVKTETEEGV